MLILIVFLPFAAAIASYVAGRESEKSRDSFLLAITATELVLCLCLPFILPSLDIPYVFGGGLHFITDGFRSVYAIITAFMWMMTTLFSREYFLHEKEGLNRYYMFVLMTLGATEGVMLSADLMTAFVFFEILSFTSFTWVIHEQKPDAIKAGYRYLFIAVIGGLVLFMGLALLYHAAGTLEFAELRPSVEDAEKEGMILAAGICILFGFGCKAGMFPVHVWLPKAHPVAPSPGSALLSGVLTKVGIYGILMTTLEAMLERKEFGLLVLCLGLITMFLGALLALFSVNLKRTLACSSMSQIGFILTGIGMTTLLFEVNEEGVVLALAGTMLHMVNHSLIKLVLFMAAGVVVMNLETLTLDDIRGFGRNKLFLKIAFGLGALGISGVPLFNGYISKTLLHEGIVEGAHHLPQLAAFLHAAEWVFLITGGLTFAYMLKLFIAVFIQKHPTRQREYDAESGCMNRASTIAVFGSSILMVILGNPVVMKRLAAFMMNYVGVPMEEIPYLEIAHFHAFSLTNLSGSAISLGIGGAVYLLFVRRVLYRNHSYVNLWPKKLDLEDLVYRPMLTRWLPDFFGDVAAIYAEHSILIPVCQGILSGGKAAAGFFGENMILKPLSIALMKAAGFLGLVFSSSMDALIVLTRRTVVREKKLRTEEDIKPSGWMVLREEVHDAATPILRNFSFALMMTCLGILVILVVILLSGGGFV